MNAPPLVVWSMAIVLYVLAGILTFTLPFPWWLLGVISAVIAEILLYPWKKRTK